MIITKTPFRMSFFGGGTDIPAFFRKYGGSVLSTTFDKYCYITVRHLPPFFKYTTEVSYSKLERVRNIDKIKHPAVRNAMKMMDMHELRITYEADLPARTGLGTSSSFAVGLLHAFYGLKGKEVDKKTLADQAIRLERDLCGEAGGWQDQIAASFGGFNKIIFEGNDYVVLPLKISEERKDMLNDRLMLFFTGFTRFSSEIQAASAASRRKCLSELKNIHSLVDEGQRILEDGTADLDDFGRLLGQTWDLKKKTGEKISNSSIDELYDMGIKAGAVGGKLLGAGGGGFLLFYVRPEDQPGVLKALKKLMYIPFRFESDGTQKIYDAPEIFDTHGMRERLQ